ncbi:MAG: hypothetical protein LBS79_04775 [Tannerella sp.]|nr:hypothetical protein [Tannerella sp.]
MDFQIRFVPLHYYLEIKWLYNIDVEIDKLTHSIENVWGKTGMFNVMGFDCIAKGKLNDLQIHLFIPF